MTKLNLRLNDQANFIETFVKSLVADMGTLKALERKIDRIDRELQGLIPRLCEVERRTP
jgi:ferritin